MKASPISLKPTAVLLIFGMVWPPSASALRTQQSKDNLVETAGLESSLQSLEAEMFGSRTAGLEEPRLVMQHGVVSRENKSARFFFRPTDQALIAVTSRFSNPVEVFKVPTKAPVPMPDFLRHAWLYEPRPVRFSPNGDRLYMLRKMHRGHAEGRSDMWGQKISILEWLSGKVKEIELRADFEVKDFELSSDGSGFYLLGFDQRSQQWVIRSFDGKTGKKLDEDHNLPFSPPAADYSLDIPLEFVLSPNGKGFYLRAQGGTHGRSFIHFYDLGARVMSKPIFSIEEASRIFRGNEPSLKTLAISPDSKVLYWGIPDDDDPLYDQILVLDLESKQIQTTAKIPGRLISMDVNPDGTLTILTGFIGGKNRDGKKLELANVYQGDLGVRTSAQISGGPRALITDASKGGLEETIFDETLSGDDLESGKADVDNLWESYERMRVRLQETLWQRVWRRDPVWSRFSEDVEPVS